VSVTDDQRESYDRRGFFRIDGFADPATGNDMLRRVVELARRAASGEDISPAFVLAEQQLDLPARRGSDESRRTAAPEEVVSKIFRLARDPVFHAFATRSDVVAIVSSNEIRASRTG